MMKKSLFIIAFTVLPLATSADWRPPQFQPPICPQGQNPAVPGCDAPVTVSSGLQIKEGPLTVGRNEQTTYPLFTPKKVLALDYCFYGSNATLGCMSSWPRPAGGTFVNSITSTVPGLTVSPRTGDVIISGSITGGGLSGEGTTGYLPKWTGGNTLGDSKVYEQGDTLQVKEPVRIAESNGSRVVIGTGARQDSTAVSVYTDSNRSKGISVNSVNGPAIVVESGRSGFGVSTPSAMVEIKDVYAIKSGALHTDGGLRFKGIGAAKDKILASLDDMGNAEWKTKEELGLGGGGTPPNPCPPGATCPSDPNEVGTLAPWRWVDESDSDITNQNSRNVGIGTLSPQAKLHIVGGLRTEATAVAGNTGVALDVSGGIRLNDGTSAPDKVLAAIDTSGRATWKSITDLVGDGAGCSINESAGSISCDGKTITVPSTSRMTSYNDLPAGAMAGWGSVAQNRLMPGFIPPIKSLGWPTNLLTCESGWRLVLTGQTPYTGATSAAGSGVDFYSCIKL